jgi:hypothetical protein
MHRAWSARRLREWPLDVPQFTSALILGDHDGYPTPEGGSKTELTQSARAAASEEMMAQHRTKQSEWPLVRRLPQACFLLPDGIFESERSLAGPLRTGTAPGVGPRGNQGGGESRTSDFGMDRVERRPVDRMGVKYPETDAPVRLVADEVREYGRTRRRR